ncbi:MAG: LPS export ABC transporter periplasmic protein LptC [Bacteroidales bacterium]|nr:LPS export ABC transporter periplasmic protein LptC [Bacteroidales bacterium]
MTLLGVTLFFVACKNDIEKVDAILGSNVKYPNQSADSIETIYSDSGVVKLKLKAPKLLAFDNEKEPYVEFPEGIDVLFYGKTLEIESRITAGYAKWKTKQNVWEARDDVVVNNYTDSMKLNTELLIWDQQKEKIYSNKFVRITTNQEVIWGNGLEANQNLTQYKILKIKGDLSIDKE